tara:strand:- start:4499 stop:4714 length:216 start_codon:yes stop_codon:yes gene_type:complete
MYSESFSDTLRINEITTEILASYEKIGKTSAEVRDIVKSEYCKLDFKGSTLLWVNYGKKDLFKNSVKTLGI